MECFTSVSNTCKLLLKIILCCMCVESFSAVDPESCQRATEYGDLKGIVKEVLPGNFVELYLGIPYVKKPIGDLRFEYPQPPDPWTTPLEVTSLPPACPQISWSYVHKYSPGFNRTSEDCLYMNIYVPQTKSKRLSVLLWIHGGSNEVGMGAMLPGEVLAAYSNLIVVTFNYRLATLGFLHMENNDFPGNLGISDQMEALSWVHRNIHRFAGDPDKVTLAGHSAGAVDAAILLMNPKVKGMFRHAVVMSGSPVSYWATIPTQLKPAYSAEVERYLLRIGCHGDPDDVKQCLKTKTTDEVTKTNFKLLHLLLLPHPVVIDNYMLNAPPIDMLEGGHGGTESIPIMIGFTRDEGSLGAEYFYKKRKEKFNMDALVETVDHFKDVTKGFDGLTESVIHEYRDYAEVHNRTQYIRAFSKIEGDISMIVPAVQLAVLLRTGRPGPAAEDNNNVYLYSFEFESHDSFKSKYPWLVGVPHGRDLFYLFGVPLVGHALHKFSPADTQMSRRMMEIWGNFVKHGYPAYTVNGDEHVFKPFTKETNSYIRFLNNGDDAIDIRSQDDYNFRRYAFWTSLVPKLASVCENSRKNESILMNAGSPTSVTYTFLFIVLSHVIHAYTCCLATDT